MASCYFSPLFEDLEILKNSNVPFDAYFPRQTIRGRISRRIYLAYGLYLMQTTETLT